MHPDPQFSPFRFILELLVEKTNKLDGNFSNLSNYFLDDSYGKRSFVNRFLSGWNINYVVSFFTATMMTLKYHFDMI